MAKFQWVCPQVSNPSFPFSFSLTHYHLFPHNTSDNNTMTPISLLIHSSTSSLYLHLILLPYLKSLTSAFLLFYYTLSCFPSISAVTKTHFLPPNIPSFPPTVRSSKRTTPREISRCGSREQVRFADRT